MRSGERLWWGVGVAGTLLIGLLIGIWLGGEIEQDAFIEMISKAEMTQDCRDQQQRAASAIVEAWEKPVSP